MKASVHRKYGDSEQLNIEELEVPQPAPGEVRIKVHAATVNRTDTGRLSGKPYFVRLFWGLKRPNIPVSGTDFAGVVDVLGRGVSGYVIGDRVWGFHDDGASSHAEHITFPTSEAISLIPEGLTFAQAAACAEGAHYAFYFMDGLGIGHGHKVLVNGATGAIGSALVQMLKASGADVTAVCATPHILMVKDLGAKRVIDYLKEDFTRDTEK